MILTKADGLAPGALPTMEASFEVKDATDWEFEGYSNTWERDLQWDRILPGAFKESIAEFQAGRKIPLLDQHRRGSFRDVYGTVVHAEETRKGLWTRFRVVQSQDGAELMARIREGAIDALSIGFSDVRFDEDEEDGGRLIHSLKWMETSAVIWPANQSSRIGVAKVRAHAGTVGTAPDDPHRLAVEASVRRLHRKVEEANEERWRDAEQIANRLRARNLN